MRTAHLPFTQPLKKLAGEPAPPEKLRVLMGLQTFLKVATAPNIFAACFDTIPRTSSDSLFFLGGNLLSFGNWSLIDE